MAAVASRTTSLVLLLSLAVMSPASLAFQSEAQVAIVPRVRPVPGAADVGASPPAHLRMDVSLALIPVHVTTLLGVSVTSLAQDNFRLFEDGVEQKITTFAKDDAPISIGLLFDSSGSMYNKMQKSSEAAATFFKTANSDDEFFLVEFNERPKLAVPFTQDSDELYRRIVRTHPTGRTSLLDAIHLAMVQMKKARNLRKAIVILSDGGDNRSRYTAREIKGALLESDVQVYAMGIFDEDDRKHTSEEKNGPRLLDELTEQSGGRHYPVEHLQDLPAISARIGIELRNQYVLGYSPVQDSRDGKYRRVKVTLVADPGAQPMKAYYRQGYYAPTQ